MKRIVSAGWNVTHIRTMSLGSVTVATGRHSPSHRTDDASLTTSLVYPLTFYAPRRLAGWSCDTTFWRVGTPHPNRQEIGSRFCSRNLVGRLRKPSNTTSSTSFHTLRRTCVIIVSPAEASQRYIFVAGQTTAQVASYWATSTSIQRGFRNS